MSMSESERRLLLSGTLDTSGVGAGANEHLAEVSLAWKDGDSLVFSLAGKDEVGIPIEELLVDGKDPKVAAAEREAAKREQETAPPVDPPKAPAKRAAKKTTASKPQASKPAES